jgi:hypothetical protein
MKMGMLWFDEDSESSVARRIERASEYYQSKYGHKPNVCFVHPGMIEGIDDLPQATLRVASSLRLLENHFWIGVEEEQ